MINDLFSKRNKKENILLTFNKIPDNFRVQVIHIMRDSIGRYNTPDMWGRGALPSNKIWGIIHKELCKEYGLFQLSENGINLAEQCLYFAQEADTDRFLDILEFSLFLIENIVKNMDSYDKEISGITQSSISAVYEINERFKENGLGYQYIKGQIVRVDSEYIYKEAVQPAVNLLFNEGFEGALEEFMNAHEHFRKGYDKEAVTEAEKAFESVMKTICIKKKWKLPKTQNANQLIKTLIENNLIPSWIENSMLGLPSLRNKLTAHGQGEKSLKIPQYFVNYALNLCATNINFLIESFKENSNHKENKN